MSTFKADYSTQVTNVNFRLRHNKPIDLKKLHSTLPNISKLYYRPSQLAIKDEKGTIICFRNGKMRIMGCVDELEATFLAYKYTLMLDDNCDFQPVFTQSMTVRADCFMKMNLSKFAQESKILPLQYEPELFPAVLIQKFKPISVNIFSTGKIIMCGAKDIAQVDDIMYELLPELKKFQIL